MSTGFGFQPCSSRVPSLDKLVDNSLFVVDSSHIRLFRRVAWDPINMSSCLKEGVLAEWQRICFYSGVIDVASGFAIAIGTG
jgi:hypothetical protein